MSFVLLLFVRLSSVLLVQTCFVADEYWQSLEVAHRWVFGYGYLTWEWRERLRSVLYPGLFAALYKLLALLHLDTVWLLTTSPRVLSAVITAVGDASTLRLAEKIFGPACRRWVTMCLLSCWFIQYCAPRTITAVPESTFTALALAAYPWYRLRVDGSLRYLWWVGIGCVLRPTTALLFVPLFTSHLMARYHVGAAPRLLFKAILIGCSVSACLCCVDSLYYGRLTFVPWNFLRFNALSGGLADHYGTHPWHWYFSSGLPSALGFHLVPLLLGIWRSHGRYNKLLVPIGFTIAAYSCVGHKEIRMLLPLLPPLMAVTGDYLSQAQRVCVNKIDAFFHRTWIMVPCLTVPSAVLLLVLGLMHQRGPLAVMNDLHGRLLPEWQQQGRDAGLGHQGTRGPMLLFLAPCHSTPLYSHLHTDVPVRFLTCEPNIHSELNYTDEAGRFYEQPEAWLTAHLPPPPGNSEAVWSDQETNIDGMKSNVGKTGQMPYNYGVVEPLPTYPSHIIMFDSLAHQLKSFIKSLGYHLCSSSYHSFAEDGRRGQFLNIYCLNLTALISH